MTDNAQTPGITRCEISAFLLMAAKTPDLVSQKASPLIRRVRQLFIGAPEIRKNIAVQKARFVQRDVILFLEVRIDEFPDLYV